MRVTPSFCLRWILPKKHKAPYIPEYPRISHIIRACNGLGIPTCNGRQAAHAHSASPHASASARREGSRSSHAHTCAECCGPAALRLGMDFTGVCPMCLDLLHSRGRAPGFRVVPLVTEVMDVTAASQSIPEYPRISSPPCPMFLCAWCLPSIRPQPCA